MVQCVNTKRPWQTLERLCLVARSNTAKRGGSPSAQARSAKRRQYAVAWFWEESACLPRTSKQGCQGPISKPHSFGGWPTSPTSPKRRFSWLWGHGSKPDAVELDAVEEDLLEWMVVWSGLVWSAPQPKGLEYVDGVSRDTPAVLRELDDNKLILWAISYDLRWIEGSEKNDVLRDVFNIELDENDEEKE
jgi:hypothetical protein